MTRLVLLRARAHRLLLAAALLTVLLTTAVLATLTAYAGAIGDAALRHSLQSPRNAADSALVVKAEVPGDRREAADTAVRQAARRVFAGLPVTVRALVRSGPYALPRSLQPPSERSGDPALTYLAALDATQIRIVEGRAPRDAARGVEGALPETAARRLGLRPGARLTLVDRLGGPKVRVTLTGVYRPRVADAPYWQLDDLGGRGIKTVDFTTYGPLLAAPAVVTGGGVSAGQSGWLASADFSRLTTARIGELRKAARSGGAALRGQSALGGTTEAATGLPDVLDRVQRSLLVSRSTLLIIALQLGLLAGCALLLVARLLSAERSAETRLLRARGASRTRIASFAALEALFLALPAVVCAPLLAAPLTRLLARQGSLARIGLHLDVPAGGRLGVWLVAAGVALGCAFAVTLPALRAEASPARALRGQGHTSGGARARRGRGRAGASAGLRLGWRRAGASAGWGLGWRHTDASAGWGPGRRHTDASPGLRPGRRRTSSGLQPGEGRMGPSAGLSPGKTPTDLSKDLPPDKPHTGPNADLSLDKPHTGPNADLSLDKPPTGPNTDLPPDKPPTGPNTDLPPDKPPTGPNADLPPDKPPTSPSTGLRPRRSRPGVDPGPRPGRAQVLPGSVRGGADLGLLAVAGVAYWQLGRQTSGAVTPARSGTLGIDPLLVAAPALALLAGTVLTLRLLPLVARLAERRAAGGRGLTAALAGWQLSRRPMRGAGPVLLLVLAVALGMLAIGQGASWTRSQSDQADFAAGAPVRVLGAGEAGPGRTEAYAALRGVRETAPAVRAELPLSGDRTADLLALDTAHAADMMLLRRDLSPEPVRPLLAPLGPRTATVGAQVPTHTVRLDVTTTLRGSGGTGTSADVTATLEDRYGTPYAVPVGELPGDGHPHILELPLPGEPLKLTGLQLVVSVPRGRSEQHRLTIGELTAHSADGSARSIPLPTSWKVSSSSDGNVSSPDPRTNPEPPTVSSSPLTVAYGTGYVPVDEPWASASLTVRAQVAQTAPPEVTAVATDRFLASAGAHTGQRVDVTLSGETVPVRIVRSVRELPTTGDADGGALLVDLRAVNRVLEGRYGVSVTPTEWWLRTDPGATGRVAAALRALPDLDPSQVVVRDETAAQLRDDPFGAGPEAAFAAAAGVAAALAAVGFAVSAAGSLRERGAELAVLRALGAPRRRLARMIAVEQGVLVALALVVGTALGTALARAVIPLIVLTTEATRPVPGVLVRLPVGDVAVLLAAVAVTPLVVTAALAVRRGDPVVSLREQGGE
ncbi:FtsX-like permease family protein [Streptomyces sp. NPDC005799]|uniref:FtsX-like permease family protein n=1 Tax=Streptomyces sp. NPDC005799 TaxID=3154678 RepID=UPI0033F123FF